MPEMDGIQASRIIKKEYPETAIIAFSMFDDCSAVMNMLQAGADGYLVKSSSKEEVINAIRTVNNGTPYYCSTISEKIYGRVVNSRDQAKENKKIQFSQQEQKVMQLICRQLSSKEIAGTMNLAVRTVENYRHHIQEKIGARNVVGIALYAIVHEIVKYSELAPSPVF
jgi:DNA-binding NarL/FixJ family response regulator